MIYHWSVHFQQPNPNIFIRHKGNGLFPVGCGNGLALFTSNRDAEKFDEAMDAVDHIQTLIGIRPILARYQLRLCTTNLLTYTQ